MSKIKKSITTEFKFEKNPSSCNPIIKSFKMTEFGSIKATYPP